MGDEKQAKHEARDAQQREPQEHEAQDREWRERELEDLSVGGEHGSGVQGGGGGNWSG